MHLLDARSAYAHAVARWPTITSITIERFWAFIRERSGTANLAFTDDLFLACACSTGCDNAAAAFDVGPLRQASTAVGRIAKQGFVREEILQRARIKLLTGRPPLIASYSGSGPLLAWVRCALVRMALDVGTEIRRAVPVEALDFGDAGPSPEEALDGARFGSQIELALTIALSRLSGGERRLLRRYFIDELSVDDLASELEIHRSTVARRLILLRGRIRRDLECFAERAFGMTSIELRQSCRALEYALDVPLSALFDRALDAKRPSAVPMIIARVAS